MGALDFKPFDKRIYLSSPTMHGDEFKYISRAYETNWMSTVGENIDQIEKLCAEFVGCDFAVALTTGTAALHMAVKLAGVKRGDRVFVSNTTFAATVNPIVYEGGIPVFIGCEKDTWNMDPEALEKAFQTYPDVKVVVAANLYGTPLKYDEICSVCKKYNAILIEDSAESLGSTYKGAQAGSFGEFNILSFNGNKIITGTSGGMLLTNDVDSADKVRKWSTQSRDNALWYQHSELGYNYRMSNLIAGVIRGQMPYLSEHIAKKKAIYMRYKDAFADLPVSMNPYLEDIMEPNFWMSCMLIDKEYMCKQYRTDLTVTYEKVDGKSCPTEILELLDKYNIEGRPLWKPMHKQPFYADYDYFSGSNEILDDDIFERGLCLPSDINMTVEQQDVIIELIKSCFA